MRSFPRLSALVAVLALLAASAAPARADHEHALNTRQGGDLPDVPAIALAYGELSVFVLDVAAGHDGVPRDPVGEQAFVHAFAQQVLDAFPTLSPELQQNLAELPQARDELRQLWPSLPVEQRQQVRRQWADGVAAMATDLPCDVFDALARAYLLPADPPYKEPLMAYLVSCWNQHPHLAKGRDGRDLAAERARQQQSGGDNHAMFVGLMNAETTRYAGTMNMLSIMSGDPYRWTVK